MSKDRVVTVAERVTHTPHYRRTLSGPDVTTEVFIQINRSWQVEHEHLFTDLSRDGSAICHGCGAIAWSERWVVDGWQGENTHAWADSLYRAYQERLEADRAQITSLKHLAAQMNSVALVADVRAEEPARVADDTSDTLEVVRMLDMHDDLYDPSM